MSSKRGKSKSRKDSEEPEICLFQVPTFKPKTYKVKTELKDFKSNKVMDIKVFNNGIQFLPAGKKRPKKIIEYAILDDITKVDGSPELIRFMTKSKGKKICYQITVTDEVNRNKLLEYLEDKTIRSKKHKTQPATESKVTTEATTEKTDNRPKRKSEAGKTHSTYEDAPIKNSSLAPSESSRNQIFDMNYNYGPPTEDSNGNQNPKQGSTIRHGGMTGRESEVPFNRKSRSNMFNVGYADDDFSSVNDQQIRGMRSEYPPRHPESFYYSRSRISEEAEYVDDDYQDESSSGYEYDYSEYSEETVVVRPVKPRSLTFYTPFLKVPQPRVPFYS
ncbi:hypothetical protein ACTXT7_009795 [Hymenolepis weldensis]